MPTDITARVPVIDRDPVFINCGLRVPTGAGGLRDIGVTGVVWPGRRNAGLGKVLEDALNVEQRLALNIEMAVIEGQKVTKGACSCVP